MSTFNFAEILENAENENFVQPEGKKVPAVITSAVYAESKGGNPMITVRAKITGGPHAGKGRPLYGYIMVETASGVNQLFNAGISKSTFQALEGRDQKDAWTVIASELENRKVSVDIRHDRFNDRVSAKVSWINPAAGVTGPKPVAAETPKPTVVYGPDHGEGSNGESELARLQRELAEAKAANQESAPARSSAPDDLPF